MFSGRATRVSSVRWARNITNPTSSLARREYQRDERRRPDLNPDLLQSRTDGIHHPFRLLRFRSRCKRRRERRSWSWDRSRIRTRWGRSRSRSRRCSRSSWYGVEPVARDRHCPKQHKGIPDSPSADVRPDLRSNLVSIPRTFCRARMTRDFLSQRHCRSRSSRPGPGPSPIRCRCRFRILRPRIRCRRLRRGQRLVISQRDEVRQRPPLNYRLNSFVFHCQRIRRRRVPVCRLRVSI